MFQISDTYYVQIEEGCVSLVKKAVVGSGSKGKVAKPENVGKERFDVVAHYGTIRQAMLGYITRFAVNDDVTTAKDIIDVMNNAVNRVEELLKEYSGGKTTAAAVK